jgi:hypothetical protein
LATAALVFGSAAASEAGWYKKAKKAAKKATKQVEKIGHSIEKEVRTGDIAKTWEKAKGDARSTLAKADKDRLRVIDKGFSDISREGNRFGRDVSYEFKKGLPSISMGSVNKGLARLDYNKNRGWDHLAENIHGGIGTGGHNIGAGLDKAWKGGAVPMPVFLPFPARVLYQGPVYFGPGAPQLYKSLDDLLTPGGFLDRSGRAIGDELNRGGLQNEVFGGPKVTDLDKSQKDELPTGKVANPLSEKKGKSVSLPESSEAPIAIFRTETDTGMRESTGGSTSIVQERTSTTGPGLSTGSSSESPGLGGLPTTGKKETTSTQSTGTPSVGGTRGGRR